MKLAELIDVKNYFLPVKPVIFNANMHIALLHMGDGAVIWGFHRMKWVDYGACGPAYFMSSTLTLLFLWGTASGQYASPMMF